MQLGHLPMMRIVKVKVGCPFLMLTPQDIIWKAELYFLVFERKCSRSSVRPCDQLKEIVILFTWWRFVNPPLLFPQYKERVSLTNRIFFFLCSQSLLYVVLAIVLHSCSVFEEIL
jgi:hypothetical protein